MRCAGRLGVCGINRPEQPIDQASRPVVGAPNGEHEPAVGAQYPRNLRECVVRMGRVVQGAGRDDHIEGGALKWQAGGITLQERDRHREAGASTMEHRTREIQPDNPDRAFMVGHGAQ